MVAISYGSAILHSMMKNETQLTRTDKIELIADHALAQGLYSAEYLDILQGLTDTQLDTELTKLEGLAMSFFDMPRL